LNRRKGIEQEGQFREKRAALEATADRAQRHLAAVVSELPFGVILADVSGTIILDNARMRDLYGGPLPHNSSANALAMEFSRPDGMPYDISEQPLARSLRQGEIVNAEELQMRRADEGTVHMLASAAPVREADGRIIAAVGLFQNVAELRETTRERIESEQFRELFINAIGHDLRNPLTVITTGAASLARHRHTDADARIAARLTSSAERMERMIAQLLDLVQSRLPGGLTLSLEKTDLREIMRSVIYRLDVEYPHRSIELSDDGALVGRFDHERMAAVVHDVLQNALEHGRGDTPVNVRLYREGNEANVEILNRGEMIPAAMLPLIFDPFQRAAERKRLKSTGLGLGLYLALQTVRAHDGTMQIDSSESAGTHVRIRLPLSDD
jgi:signal transduction histidine kinase